MNISDEELHNKFAFYGEQHKKNVKEYNKLLKKLKKRKVWKKEGFSSFDEYVKKLEQEIENGIN